MQVLCLLIRLTILTFVLAQVLVGHPDYEVTGGTMTYKGQDLLEFEPEERCHLGLFMRCVSFTCIMYACPLFFYL